MKRREHTYELWQDGIMVASATSTNRDQARREAKHYAGVYSQDGPVEVRTPEGESIIFAARNRANSPAKASKL